MSFAEQPNQIVALPTSQISHDEMGLIIEDIKNESRLLKEFRVVSHLQEEGPGSAERCLSDSKLIKWDLYHTSNELNGWYKELHIEETYVCQEIAIQSLLVLNDCVFDGMPSELRLKAETEGVTDIFQMFALGTSNGRLKHDLLSRLPHHLRFVSRIMDFVRRKLSTNFKYHPEDNFELFHPKICKRIAREMASKKFELHYMLTDHVIKFINSDPKYRGVSIFCDADEEDQTNVDSIRSRIQLCEDRIRGTTGKLADALIEKWESDDWN